MTQKSLSFAILAGFFLAATIVYPQTDKNENTTITNNQNLSKRAVVIVIENEVDPGLATFLKRAVAEAKAQNPDYIIFEINTFGGRLDAAFDIVDIISEIKSCSTVAFVNQKAISAGALIALACNRLVMESGTTIGDCAPILQGKEGIVMAGEKIESPLRAKFRNLAEKNGYPLLLSQAMVSIDMQILKAEKNHHVEFFTQQHWDDLSPEQQKQYTGKKTIVAKGELLTMTDQEARDYGFSEGSFSSLESFLESRGWTSIASIVTTWSEEMVRTIGKFAPILMLLGFGALYMEIKTPGFGMFGIIGIICLLIVFGSKYMTGLADYVELILLFAGITLFLVEIYIMPGTMIFGAAGLALIIASLILSMQSFTIPDPGMPWQKDILVNNILFVIFTALASLLIPFLGAKYIIPHLPASMQMIASETLENARVSSVKDEHPELAAGMTGTTSSMLRPSGKIEISNRRLDACAFSGFIEKDRPIEIVRIEGNKIIVKEVL